jgi:RNA-directed DNA polymerase
MYDRAMQALYALALGPVAEATADIASFGFRKYRSAQDACDQAFKCLCRRNSAQWILEGDIKGCFDNINHEWLLDNILMDRSILTQFLKAGFVYKHHLNPTKAGTPQGGIISPILANHYVSYCTSSILSVTFNTLDRQVGLLCFAHLIGRFSPGSSYSAILLSL